MKPMKKPSFALVTKVLLALAVLATLGAAGWGLLVSFDVPLSPAIQDETKEEVAVARTDLNKHLGAGKTLSKVLGLNPEFDVKFEYSYIKLNEECVARSRTREYGFGEDYKANEAVNNPFSPRAIVGPSSSVCDPR